MNTRRQDHGDSLESVSTATPPCYYSYKVSAKSGHHQEEWNKAPHFEGRSGSLWAYFQNFTFPLEAAPVALPLHPSP